MLTVILPPQKILKIMAVNYCGLRQARRLGWAAPACHKNVGAILHHGVCKFSLQYDVRPDGRFGVRVGTWNSEWKGRDVCEELRKRMIDVCCLQVVREGRVL